jgi:hypothetical protein
LVTDGSSGSSGSDSGGTGDWREVEDFSTKVNPILQHLSLGFSNKQMYIGANFRF